MTSGIVLGIRLRFHHHTPQEAAVCLPFHQPAANQVWSNNLRWTAEEGVGQGLGERGGGLDGYWSGLKTELADWCNGRNISRKLKLLPTALSPPSPMSEEQLKAFLEKVKGDTSLQDKLKAAASPDAAIEIAKDAGFSITAEDIQSMQSATVELSDEELEGAAGGRRLPTQLRRSCVCP